MGKWQDPKISNVADVVFGPTDTVFIRTGDRLDNIWDDATGAWRDIHDGNLSDAGKKILSLNLNMATELFRAMDLLLIGGAVRTVAAAGFRRTP